MEEKSSSGGRSDAAVCPGRPDRPHSAGGDSYDFVDRVWEGYTGRWRYRVTHTDASTLHRKTTLEVLFKRRADACDFVASSGLFGQESGWRRITASGCRPGEDFKVVRAHSSEAPPLGSEEPA